MHICFRYTVTWKLC